MGRIFSLARSLFSPRSPALPARFCHPARSCALLLPLLSSSSRVCALLHAFFTMFSSASRNAVLSRRAVPSPHHCPSPSCPPFPASPYPRPFRPCRCTRSSATKFAAPTPSLGLPEPYKREHREALEWLSLSFLVRLSLSLSSADHRTMPLPRLLRRQRLQFRHREVEGYVVRALPPSGTPQSTIATFTRRCRHFSSSPSAIPLYLVLPSPLANSRPNAGKPLGSERRHSGAHVAAQVVPN